jgi:hypothetical protein
VAATLFSYPNEHGKEARLGGDDRARRGKDFCAVCFGIAATVAALLAQEGAVAMVVTPRVL